MLIPWRAVSLDAWHWAELPSWHWPLVAGGGGDGRDSDSQRSLLDVYNKLEDGMGPAEVTALVGRTAEEIGGSYYGWRNSGDEYLNLNFNNGSGTQLSGAQWGIGGTSNSRSKGFKEV